MLAVLERGFNDAAYGSVVQKSSGTVSSGEGAGDPDHGQQAGCDSATLRCRKRGVRNRRRCGEGTRAGRLNEAENGKAVHVLGGVRVSIRINSPL